MIAKANLFLFALLSSLSAIWSAPLWAKTAALSGPFPAEVDRVVDGDTVRVRATIWVDQVVDVSVRLDGVDAPEIFRPKCAFEKSRGVAAREFVRTFLEGEEIRLVGVRHGKYAGRVVGRIETGRGDDLGGALIKAGLAAPYRDRGARPNWCA